MPTAPPQEIRQEVTAAKKMNASFFISFDLELKKRLKISIQKEDVLFPGIQK
jgi:hypothetical protein